MVWFAAGVLGLVVCGLVEHWLARILIHLVVGPPLGAFLESQDLDSQAVRRHPADSRSTAGGATSPAITIKGGSFGWGSPPQPDPDLAQIKKAVAALDKAFEAGAITEKRHADAKAFLLDGKVPGAGESTAFELSEIDLIVEKGSCLGIVGQVGSGKTVRPTRSMDNAPTPPPPVLSCAVAFVTS